MNMFNMKINVFNMDVFNKRKSSLIREKMKSFDYAKKKHYKKVYIFQLV